MKNHCIAYLFLLCHAIGLEADDKAIGASLFLGSIAAHRIMSNNQREPVDQATVMIENIKKTDHQQNLAETRQKLKDEGIGKISHQRKNDLSELLQRRFQASAKVSPCPSPATVATLSPSLSNNSLSNSAMLLAIENSSSASANSHVHKSLRRTQFVRLNEFETFAAPESTPFIHEPAIVGTTHASSPQEIEHFRLRSLDENNQRLRTLASFNDQTSLKNFLDNRIGKTIQTLHKDNFEQKTAGHNVIISTESTFFPLQSSTNNIIYVPIIHGTWATSHEHFGDKEYFQASQDLMMYAQRLAQEKDSIVKLLVVKWDGRYDAGARRQSAANLYRELQARIAAKPENCTISANIIAHSYGCDVARRLINQSTDIQFNDAFLLASPCTKIDISDKAREIHIYGDCDGIATAENFRKTCGTSTNLHNPLAQTNIRFPEYNHKTILGSFKYLHEISKIAEENPTHKSLTVKPNFQPGIIEGKRYFTLESSPDHSDGRDDKPSFTDCVRNEAESRGVGNNIATQATVACVSILESIFGGKGSSASASSRK